MTDNIFIHLLYSYMHLSFPRKRVYCLLYFVNSFFYPFHHSVCFSFVSLHNLICICTFVCVMFIPFEYLLYCSLILFRNTRKPRSISKFQHQPTQESYSHTVVQLATFSKIIQTCPTTKITIDKDERRQKCQ